MTDDEIVRLHNMALGEALYASALAQGVFVVLTQSWQTEAVVTLIDTMLLALERNQAESRGGPAAVEHARARMIGLLSVYSGQRVGSEPG